MFEYMKSAIENGTIVAVPTMGENQKGTTTKWKDLIRTNFNDIKDKKSVLIKIPEYTDPSLFKFVVIDVDGRKFSQKNTDFTFEVVNILFNKLYNHLINLGWEEGKDFLTVTTANDKKHFYIAVKPVEDDKEVVSKQNNHLLKNFRYGSGPLEGEKISNDIELFGYHSQSLIMAPESQFSYGTYNANTEFDLESLVPKTYSTIIKTIKNAFEDWYDDTNINDVPQDNQQNSDLSFLTFDKSKKYERKKLQDFNVVKLSDLLLEAFMIEGMPKHEFEIAICEYLGKYLYQDQLNEVKKLILKKAPESLFNDIINFNTNWIVNDDVDKKTGLKTALQLINIQKGGDYAQRWQNRLSMAMEYAYYILPIIDDKRARSGSKLKGFYVSHRGIAEETFEVCSKEGEKPFLLQTGIRENVFHDNMVISISEFTSDIQVTEDERVFSIIEEGGRSYTYVLKRFKNQYQGFERFLVLAAANGYIEKVNAPAYPGFYLMPDNTIKKYDISETNRMEYIEPICPLRGDVKNAIDLYSDIAEAIGIEEKIAIGSFIVGTVIPFGYLFRQDLKRLMPTLILAGDAGTGKSVLAKSLANFYQTILPRKITYGPGDVSTAFGFVHNCMESTTFTCVIDEADKVLTPSSDHYNIFKDAAEKIDVRETTWNKSYARVIPILTLNPHIEQNEETAPILRRNVCYNLYGNSMFDPDTISNNLSRVIDKDGMFGVRLSELGAIGEYIYYYLHEYFKTPRTGNVLQIAEEAVKSMFEYIGDTDNKIYNYITNKEKLPDVYRLDDDNFNLIEESKQNTLSIFYTILRLEFLKFRNSNTSQRPEFLEASTTRELFKTRVIKGLHPWIEYYASTRTEKYYIKDVILTHILSTNKMINKNNSVMAKRRIIKDCLQLNKGVLRINGKIIRATEIDIDDLLDNIL